MPDDRLVNGVVILFLVVAIATFLFSPSGPLGGLVSPVDHEQTTLTIHDDNGTTIGTVDVRISDTDRERFVGLSETERLADGDGMLFVHEQSGTFSYVMRNMSFPLDIVFIDGDGTITEIHHAPVADDPSNPQERYRGTGRYVLEVPLGWTNESGITVGDRVSIPDSVID